jgi:hypothetical protein
MSKDGQGETTPYEKLCKINFQGMTIQKIIQNLPCLGASKLLVTE